jgi:hypothetical protein
LSRTENDYENLRKSLGLLSKFSKLLKKNLAEDYVINVYTEKYKVIQLIESFGINEVHKMVDYYFEVTEKPSWNHFIKNTDKVRKSMLNRQSDIQTRKILQQQAQEWLSR